MNQPTSTIKPIAYIRTDFHERFGIPRQAGLIGELTAAIVFEKEFRDPNAVRGIDGYSHLWLIWSFSETQIDMTAAPVKWSSLVAPPRLGGKTKVGVFATRSPYRPNSLGLSSVRLLSVDLKCKDAPVLLVSGADILDGTAIFDIKPYLPYTDCHPDAVNGFADIRKDIIPVIFPPDLLERIPEEKRAAVLKVLGQDPRGAYEKQPGFVYGLNFAEYDIRFIIENDILKVFDVCPNFEKSGFSKVK